MENKNKFFPDIKILKNKITVGDVLKRPLPKDEPIEIYKISELTLNSIKHIKGGSWKDIPDEHLSKHIRK